MFGVRNTNISSDILTPRGNNEFWRLTSQPGTYTLTDFINILHSEYPQYISQIGKRLGFFKIAPRDFTLTNVPDQSVPPSFTWQVDGSKHNPNNQFRIAFYDENGIQKYETENISYTLTPAAPPFQDRRDLDTASYTLLQYEWDAVLSQFPTYSTINIVVKGYLSSLPESGPYWSEYASMMSPIIYATRELSFLTIDITGANVLLKDSVTIPSVLYGKNVVSIADFAFRDCIDLTSVDFGAGSILETLGTGVFQGCLTLRDVYLPDSLPEISDWAFSNCPSLRYISLPSSLQTISEGAFSGCSDLRTISLPNSLLTISDRSFANCSSLESLTIPSLVNSIMPSAFSGCESLKGFSVSGNVYFYQNDNNLYIRSESGDSLFKYAPGKIQMSFKLPFGVIKVETLAFEGATNLRSVDLNSAEFVGNNAFLDCIGITSVTGGYVTFAGVNAFSDTAWYENLQGDANGFFVLGKTLLKYLGNASVLLPGDFPDVVSISAGAFEGAILLEVTLPATVEGIGDMAFYNCENLQTINMTRFYPPHAGTLFVHEGTVINVPYGMKDIYSGSMAVLNTFNYRTSNVVFDINGGSSISLQLQLCYGQTISGLPSASKDYYTFTKWKDEITGKVYQNGQLWDIYSLQTVLTAVWTPIDYGIVYYISEGVNNSRNPDIYNYESESIVLSAPVTFATGMHFTGWYDNPEFLGSPISSINKYSHGTKHLYAKLEGNVYQVSFVANAAVPAQQVVYGQTFSFTNIPEKENHVFEGWFDLYGRQYTNEHGYSVTTWTETVNLTLYARYTQIYYIISEVAGNVVWLSNEDFTSEKTHIEHGAVFKCPACCATLAFMRSDQRIREGYVFKYFTDRNGVELSCWGENVPDIENLLPSEILNGERVFKIYPYYVKESYSLVIDRNDGQGTQEIRIEYGAQIPFPSDIQNLEVNPGYEFMRWKVTATGISSLSINQVFGYSIMPDLSTGYEGWGSVTIMAEWGPKTYPVTLRYETTVITGGAVFAVHNNFQLFNKPGYRFLGWFDGENGSGTQYTTADGQSLRVWMKNYPSNLYAHFEIINYTINFSDTKFNIPVGNASYNIESGYNEFAVLESTGYRFEGWKENGILISNINPGRYGNVTLYSSWIGQAFTYSTMAWTTISYSNYQNSVLIFDFSAVSNNTSVSKAYAIDSSISEVTFKNASNKMINNMRITINSRSTALTIRFWDFKFKAQSNYVAITSSYGSLNIASEGYNVIEGGDNSSTGAGKNGISASGINVTLAPKGGSLIIQGGKGGTGSTGSSMGKAATGAQGPAGPRPDSNVATGGNGLTGGTGGTGGNGGIGLLAGNLIVDAKNNAAISLKGGMGGTGGKGGTGGEGGTGGRGGDWGAWGTQAGTGGQGGAGGKGGKGGTGGQGGYGLSLSGTATKVQSSVNMVLVAGASGVSGDGGNGARGGDGGRGGNNAGSFLPKAGTGSGGNGGQGGNGGSSGNVRNNVAQSVTAYPWMRSEASISGYVYGRGGNAGDGGNGGEIGTGNDASQGSRGAAGSAGSAGGQGFIE